MMSKNNSQSGFARSPCPITSALDLVGDKWTLVILRDLALGKSRYKQFQESPENIPSNILADRLRRMEEHDLLVKTAYQQRPPRYEYRLTQKGRDLIPLLHVLAKWSLKYRLGCWDPPERFWSL
ncbi:winged helix-turn-helix transcriptional regulator [Luteithermobacter gelatinilyticus]|uniref:winged helix-turn-helix transcriptional regulator n=1 Tax=Luteithermobacter gelatinilyticus TaxID=2582913 RepID=UPI001AEFCD13|nr:helix-turn-helix domain-containing protein [Luteithermobacter gelatinilyticus]